MDYKTFKIPRNVKTGLSFIGLDWKGWLLFLPIAVVFGGLIILLISDIRAKVVSVTLVLSITWIMLLKDENTGVMNYTIFLEYFNWLRSKKQIEPVWDFDDFKYKTLLIKKEIDNETLMKYKSFILEDRKGGDNNES